MPDKRRIVPPVNCMSCDKELKPVDDKMKDDPYDMIRRGIVGLLYAPFGSENDGYIFQIGLCDKCIEELMKKNKIKLIGDYMDSIIDKQIKCDIKKGITACR